MLKILFWLLLDAFFIYALISFGSEMGWYILLPIAFVLFFTWELLSAIKQWLE